MPYSFWFTCLLPGQCIRRDRKFWENLGYTISKVNSLQKCYEITKFDVIRIALLKPSDGQKAYPTLLSDFFLCHSCCNPILSESLA